MQIENIPLFHADFWVQIHNLPAGFMQEKVGVKLANYIGTFMEYEKNNNSSFWRQYMRVRVKVDVRQPLKKGQRVRDKEGDWCMVNFKYEKLGVFCFVCGIMGHAENKCEVRFAMEIDDGRREWSGDLRADQRRGGGRQTSRWLREDRDGGSGLSGDEGRRRENPTMENPTMGPTSAVMSTIGPEVPRHHRTAACPRNDSSNSVLTCHALTPMNALANREETDGITFTANNHSAINNRHTSRQDLMLLETNQRQQSLGNPFPSNSVTELPPFYFNPIHNNGQPYQLTNSNTLINTSLSQNNSTPVFTTQQK
jgi:hypothetical protein